MENPEVIKESVPIHLKQALVAIFYQKYNCMRVSMDIKMPVKTDQESSVKTTNPAISLVVDNVTPILIGPLPRAPITSIL